MPTDEAFFAEGGSAESVLAQTSDINTLTPADFMLLPARVAKPKYMKTRFPVPMEEYRALNAAAAQVDPAELAAVTDDTVTEDRSTAPASADSGDDGTGADVPEDGIALGAQAAGAQAPVTGNSFEATPQTGFRPPDCTMAVGPNDVLVSVNVDLAGYRKDGSLRFRWPSMTALFKNVLPAGAGLFDPKLAYDHYAQRWIVVVAARRQSPAGSWIMLAASKTADPMGQYSVWALDFAVDGSNPSTNWADYPMLGFDTQGIYISTNQFKMGGDGSFSYAKIRVLTKSQVYAGGAIGWWDFWNLKNPDNSLAFTIQPAAHFRGTGGNPPAYMANAHWPGSNKLTLWELQNPIGGGASSLQRFSVPCRAYDLPPDADQSGSSTKIETNDARLLNAVYQFAGGVQRMWMAHTTQVTWSGESVARAGVQWYEIDTPSRIVAQQGVFGASSFYYYFPVIQTDIHRNAYLLFGRSSSAEFASLRQTGRRGTDAANTLQSSVLVKAGESAYNGGRWGDYFGNARDPADPGRAWMYGGFADAANAWGTWVMSAKF